MYESSRHVPPYGARAVICRRNQGIFLNEKPFPILTPTALHVGDILIKGMSEKQRARAAGLVLERVLVPHPESGVNVTNLAAFQRLERQLGTVREKVTLCEEIMINTPNYESSDSLVEVVCFLEACQQRLPEIVEAGTMGMLCDELLCECIAVNDAVANTISSYRANGTVAADSSSSSNSGRNSGSSSAYRHQTFTSSAAVEDAVIRGTSILDEYDDEGL